MYDTILVATDGSDRTRTAIAHGLGLAETYGATVHVLYAVDFRAVGFDEEAFVVDDILDSLAAADGERRRPSPGKPASAGSTWRI